MKNARRSFGSRRSSGRSARGGAGGLFRSLRGPVRSSPSFFPKRQKSARRSGLPARSRRLAQGEMLEKRLALAVDVAFETPASAAGGEDWITVIADEGSDIYMTMAATNPRSLFIADNASFANRTEVSGIDATLDNVYVYHGQLVDRPVDFFDDPTNNLDDRYGTPALTTPHDYPFVNFTAPTTGLEYDALQFSLHAQGIDWSLPVDGQLELKDPANEVIFFSNGGSGTDLTITSGRWQGRALPYVLSREGTAANLVLTIYDDFDFMPEDSGSTGIPELTFTFDNDIDSDVHFLTVNAGTTWNLGFGGPRIEYQVFDPTAHAVVPGTLHGSIFVEIDGGLSFNYHVNTASATGLIPLAFDDPATALNERDTNFLFYESLFWEDLDIDVAEADPFEAFVQGTFDPATGVVTLVFDVVAEDADVDWPARFSAILSNTTVGLVDLTPADDASGSLGTGTTYDLLANDFTLYPGHNFSRGLTVELPNEDSGVYVESLIDTANAISLSAGEVFINAPTRSDTRVLVPSGDNTAFGTLTETVTVNAALASPSFDIRLSNDPDTSVIRKAKLVVTQTGSISNAGDVTVPLGPNVPTANELFVEVTDGDIYVEGQVTATAQTWVIASPELQIDAESLVGDYPDTEPYVFTTSSRLTGVDTGRITADTLAIDLANDMMVFDTITANGQTILRRPFYPSTAFAVMDLTTDTARLRVQAADRLGDPLEEPFPYFLTVREENDLILDAVAASSKPIDIFVDGTLDVIAALFTAGNVTLESTEPLVLGAPLSTRFGTIALTAPEIDINNSVRVLDGVQDERLVDVTVSATNGFLRMQDAVSGLNRVVLSQQGTGGIVGDARVSGDIVEVDAVGDVSIRTAATRVSVRTPAETRIDELDYGIFEVRDSSTVTLVANGFDQVVNGDEIGDPGDTRAYNSPALYADLYDTQTLTVSAPNGSIDVYHFGSQPLVVGDLGLIQLNQHTEMQAAGSVSIRSSLADMTIYDAPSAGSTARDVRMATTARLVGTYAPGSPGTIAPRITNVSITRVNASGQSMSDAGLTGVDASFRYARELDGIDVTTLRVGDRILVKDGVSNVAASEYGVALDAGVANGIYTVLSVVYPVGNTSVVQLELVRSPDADSTDELAEKHYVRVADGRGLAGKIFTADGSGRSANGTPEYLGWGGSNEFRFANVFDNGAGTTQAPVVVRPIQARSGYVVAAAVTTVPLTGSGDYGAVFDPGSQSITGTGGSYSLPDFNGVTLAIGDLLLVRYGASSTTAAGVDPRSPGLYVVVDVGNGSDEQWVLTRYAGVDDDGDGELNAFFTGRVAIAGGSLRTAATGEMFEISLRSLGFSPLRYQEVSAYTFADYEAGTSFDSILDYRTNIGTNNPIAEVDFVVSTARGTNTATGSFGRMLTLMQANSAANDRTRESQDQSLVFGVGVTQINLTQELPAIYREISIIAGGGVMVDGSRITNSATGAAVRSGSIITNTGPVRPADLASSRRLYRDKGISGDITVNGLTILDTADGAVISGLAIGGFSNGAAIQVRGADNVLIDNVAIGQTPTGARAPNKIGIEVASSVGALIDVEEPVLGGSPSVAHTTIRRATVVNSTQTGILLGAGAERVHVVASTIGLPGSGNTVGIEVASQSVIPNYVGGVQPLTSNGTILSGRILAVDIVGNTAIFEVGRSFDSVQVRVGMQVYDSANDIMRDVLAVAYAELPPAAGTTTPRPVYRLTLANANLTGTVTGRGALQVADNAVLQVGYSVESIPGEAGEGGVPANIGKVTRGDTRIVLPQGIDPGDIHLGQQVSSLQSVLSPVFSAGTLIQHIEHDGDGRVIITLSRPVLRTSRSLILFGSIGANSVTNNSDGIVLSGNSSRVVNTLVSGQVYDGIRVQNTDKIGVDTNADTFSDTFGLQQLGGARGELPVNASGRLEFVTSELNLRVYGNGLAGIRLTDRVFAALGALDSNPDPAADYATMDAFLDERLQIRGNYIGFNPTNSTEVGNGQSGIANIVVDLEQLPDPVPFWNRYADLVTINRLLFDTNDDPVDGRVRGRLAVNIEDGFDRQQNQFGLGEDGAVVVSPPRVPTPERRPVVR